MSNLVELFDNVVEFQNYNGVPLAAGKLYVFALGRTRLMDTWSDVDGESLNTNPIILDDLGQCHCYVSDSFDYTIVVCDQFDNEIFSVDKYLLSKGEHSHADVTVAPSEHIGVSSYHVGEVTVYVPYLTGEVGKTYEGIDPIVVNNTLNRISANHIPLGVQDPLYFVEDSESACIIGFSGQTVPDGVMTESALGFENNKITGYNGSAFSAGNEYEAGNYISIDNNVINVTGLSPVPADTASTGLVAEVSADIISQIPSTAGLATTAQLDEKLDKVDSANFYPMNSNPSGYINALPSDLATTGWVDSQGYLTAVDIPESATWNATTQTVSANSAAWAGGTANPQIPVTGINGIKISESGDKVVFEVSGDYYPGNNPSGFITGVDLSNYATTAQVSEKLDTTAFSTVSGDFLQSDDITGKQDVTGMTAYQPVGDYYSASNPSGFITGVDLSDYATTAELADKQDITGMTAYQPVGNYQTAGDYLTTADSANFYTTANESGFITGVDLTPYMLTANMTAYQTAGSYLSSTDSANFLLTSDSGNFYTTANESGFITGVDLTPYQLTADMTAYQPAGDYLTTADSANFYTTANESGFITGVPAGTMNESAFGYDANDKISGYNGSAFAGGSDVPEGVMAESGLEYNAVNEISGYNGSAIAQYGAEKQWLVHDDTLVHLSNSAQYALGVNLSAVAQLLGVDETVLWSGDIIQNQTAALNDNWQNYEGIKVYGFVTPGGAMYGEAKTIDLISAYDTTYNPAVWNPDIALTTIASWNHRENFNINCTLPLTFTTTTSVSAMNGRMMGYWDGKFQFTGSQPKIHLSKIIGIGRKN